MENNFYRELNLPVEIAASFSSWLCGDTVKSFRVDKKFLGEEFDSFLESLGFRVFVIHALYIPGKSFNNYIFKTFSNEENHSKIIVKYGSKSSLKFWKQKDNITVEVQNGEFNDQQDMLWIADESSLEFLSEYEQKKVSLINGSYYHNVYNESDHPVYVLIVDLKTKTKDRISWEQALKDFKDYTV
jgi:hypothetical protein